jgi:hypothetical protein
LCTSLNYVGTTYSLLSLPPYVHVETKEISLVSPPAAALVLKE